MHCVYTYGLIENAVNTLCAHVKFDRECSERQLTGMHDLMEKEVANRTLKRF